MDMDFQDRIDEYLLRGDRMSDEEKKKFLCEVEQDEEKKEQLELTQHVKMAIASREEKLKVMASLQWQYELEHEDTQMCECAMPMMERVTSEKKLSSGKIWWWISGVAVVLIAGFFIVRPMLVMDYEGASFERQPDGARGDDDIFDAGTAPSEMDSVASDTVFTDTLIEMNDE